MSQVPKSRSEAEWIRVPAPALRIVSDDLWDRAHARMNAARRIYLKGTKGEFFGRPILGNPSKYLLTNFAQCHQCGGSLQACSRGHERTRQRFYGVRITTIGAGPFAPTVATCR